MPSCDFLCVDLMVACRSADAFVSVFSYLSQILWLTRMTSMVVLLRQHAMKHGVQRKNFLLALLNQAH